MPASSKAEELVPYFAYLDELRDSGKTNMFGARSFLEEEFGLEHDYAGKILQAWMKTFNVTDSPKARALASLSEG